MEKESFLLREMTSEDISSVAQLEIECFSSPWSQQGLESELSNEKAFFYVVDCDGVIAAYMGMHIILDECYITNVAVKSDFRRRGFGELLVRNAVKQAQDRDCYFITLEVRKSNKKAVALYKKCGFETLGERKDFYSEPRENAVIMTRYFK